MRQALFITILFFSAALQMRSGQLFGFELDFALAALITIAFFATPAETIFVSALGVLWLTWRTDVSAEMTFFAVVPIACTLVLKKIPFGKTLAHHITIALGIALFYIVSGSARFLGEWKVFGADLLASLLFAVLLYRLIQGIYDPKAKGRGTPFDTLLHEGRRSSI